MEELNKLLNQHHYQLDPYLFNFEVTGWLKKEEMKFTKTFCDEKELLQFIQACIESDLCFIHQVVAYYSITTSHD